MDSIKVVLLGDSGVDKTGIINKFVNLEFDPETPLSLSSQYISKTLELPGLGSSFKFDIWDTVGQEEYRSLSQILIKMQM